MKRSESILNPDKINFLSTLFLKYPKTILCIILCFLTIAAYWPVKNYPFIGFDDGQYVLENSRISSGLSIQNILWAFSVSDAAADEDKNYWHPLTWISHMIDVQLFGLDAHKHHLTNLCFHTINTILLFLVFSLMTGDIWKCFFMSALFAIHPINIESTAWIAERKNLLSTAFWMITMLAYFLYAKKPSISRYLLVFLALGFGLLAKPMLAVLPCVLLLMDYWPLNRMKWVHRLNSSHDPDGRILFLKAFPGKSSCQLILEKIPLLLLSFATIRLSMITLQGKSQVVNSAMVPIWIRIENALVSYVVYLYKMTWPVDLAIFYPFPDSIPLWQTIGAVFLLIIVTSYAAIQSKKNPYLIIGWLWFIGVLFPVIGLVQGGLWPAQADRWAYIPLIGIYIVLAWGIPELLSKWRFRKTVLPVSAAGLILVFFLGTRMQLAYWADTSTLFNRALTVTENNFLAYRMMGKELALKGDHKTAEKYLLSALKIKSDDADAMQELGKLACQNEKYDIALDYYQKALLFRPHNDEIMYIIGNILYQRGKPDQAITYFSEALVLNPSNPEIYNKLGIVFFSKNMFEQAFEEFKAAVKLAPDFDEAHYNLGILASKQGKFNDALMHYKKAISINSNYGAAHKSLADIMFSSGDTAQALKHYSEAIRVNPDDATAHFNIGVILYQYKQITKASEHFYKAVQIDSTYEKAKIALTMTKSILKDNNIER